MQQLSYITSNPDKAKHMGRLLGHAIEPVSVTIPEIQSLDLEEIIVHKTQAAFDLIHKPLFVDDVSLVIHGMGKLPGPFVKFFLQELGTEKLCRLTDSFPSRKATAEAMIGYHDGTNISYFKGIVEGEIAKSPSGEKGFGWDEIFIPEGYTQIRAQMSDEDYDATSPRTRALEKLKTFLKTH